MKGDWLQRQRQYAQGVNDAREGKQPAQPIPAKGSINDAPYVRGYRKGQTMTEGGK